MGQLEEIPYFTLLHLVFHVLKDPQIEVEMKSFLGILYELLEHYITIFFSIFEGLLGPGFQFRKISQLNMVS